MSKIKKVMKQWQARRAEFDRVEKILLSAIGGQQSTLTAQDEQRIMAILGIN